MAEAVAVVGLVSAIVTLVDLSSKIVARILDFTAQSSDVPKSFRALADQLPLLIQTLKRVQERAQAGHVSDDIARDLKALVDSVNLQIEFLEDSLRKTLPTVNASRLAKGIKGLHSLIKDEKVTQAVEKIHSGIDVLVLHQTTTNIDLSDRILEELTSLKLDNSASQKFGLWLDRAPQIDPDAFKGRATELQQLDEWLSCKSSVKTQNAVSIVGMGGLGKTQLSLAYAHQYGSQFSSVFWFNAKDKLSLQQSFLTLHNTVFANDQPSSNDGQSEEIRIQKVLRWLSESSNDSWLLIFDNYDDPALPSARSSTGFDVRAFFPSRAQGSILITTRSPKLTFSRRLMLTKLNDVPSGLAILSHRTKRVIDHELDAEKLVRRLDGLPLALATAGTYIGQTGISCAEYLELYEESWSELHGPESEQLLEYADRTLSSTWKISLEHVSREHADAAELLKFFALLNNEDIWYELLKRGSSHRPTWMDRVTSSKVQFNRAMIKLRDYSLVETVPGSYRIHPCVHDWLLEGFLSASDQSCFTTALNCVVANLPFEEDPEYWTMNWRLIRHVQRLDDRKFKPLWESYACDKTSLVASRRFAALYHNFDQYESAAEMCQRTLPKMETLLGPEHWETLLMVNIFGTICHDQGKLNEAEQMYQRSLVGQEKILGPSSRRTLETVNNLAILYQDQGNLEKAGDMYMRAIAKFKEVVEPDATWGLNLMLHVGNFYCELEQLDKAEEIYLWVSARYEKAYGPDHITTLTTVVSLGNVYRHQGRLDEAEKAYVRALAGYENALSPDHTRTIMTTMNLSVVYKEQGELDKAEEMCIRALVGYEKVLGWNNMSTPKAANNLGSIYQHQGKIEKAKEMYQRAFTCCEHNLGSDHPLTLTSAHNLANNYWIQGKLADAERLYRDTAERRRRVLGADHSDTKMVVQLLHDLQEVMKPKP